MFHAAHALLRTKDSKPRTHSGTASELGNLFKDKIDTDLLSSFSTIQQLREDADYGLEPDISKEEAEHVIETAARFLEQARDLLDT